MDFQEMLSSLQQTLGAKLPVLLKAIAIVVGGWFISVVARGLVRKGTRAIKLDDRFNKWTGNKLAIESIIANVVFYFALLCFAMMLVNVLGLTFAGPFEELLDRVFGYAPRLAGGALLALVAFLLATLSKTLLTRGLASTALDEKVADDAGVRPMSQNLGEAVYWLVLLVFLPAVLDALQLNGLLGPVQTMVDEILGMLPNIVAAVAIGFVGWFVARLLRNVVTNVLATIGADKFGERAGFKGNTRVSGLAGLMVYIFVFIPALIAALDALKIEVVSAPARQMLQSFMSAIPDIFAAGIIIAVAWIMASFLGKLVTSLLAGMGWDDLPGKIGLAGAFQGGLTLSGLVGKVIVFFIMVFAIVEAANRLSFTQVADLVATLIEFGGQVLLGVTIIAVGLWIAKLAHDGIHSVSNSAAFAGLARYAVLGLVFAMGLRAMGVADDIVRIAFAFTLGSIAVAVALSFGLGGREAAGRQMEHWMSRLRGGN